VTYPRGGNVRGSPPAGLLPGEVVVLHARQHPLGLAVELLGLLPRAAVLLALLAVGTHLAGMPWPMQADAAVAAAAWAAAAWLGWRAATLTLTNQRVILERGVLRHDRTAVALNDIRARSTHRSVLGRFLGTGTLELRIGDDMPLLFPRAPLRKLREEMFTPSAPYE
jgi:uncharacterized membrane protein YdbT with pleckstrin-like domain